MFLAAVYRLSFDMEGSLAKALKFIELYKEAGIEKDRVLIKVCVVVSGLILDLVYCRN